MLSDEHAPQGVYLQRATSARNRLDLIQLPDPEVPSEAIPNKCNGDNESFIASGEAHFVCKLMMHVCKTSYFVLVIWTFDQNGTAMCESHTGSFIIYHILHTITMKIINKLLIENSRFRIRI